MEEKKSLLNAKALLMGFISGSLLSAPFILAADVLLKMGVVVYGLLVLLDVLIPSREQDYSPAISIMAAVAGFVLSFVFSFNGLYTYLALSLIHI